MSEVFEQKTTTTPAEASNTLNTHRLAAWERFGGDAECISTKLEPIDGGACVIVTQYRAYPKAV